MTNLTQYFLCSDEAKFNLDMWHIYLPSLQKSQCHIRLWARLKLWLSRRDNRHGRGAEQRRETCEEKNGGNAMRGKKRQSVPVGIHYVMHDLWMDQLLRSVGMPLIDSTDADVTQHSSHASLPRYDQYVMPWPWGRLEVWHSLCCIMLPAQSCLGAPSADNRFTSTKVVEIASSVHVRLCSLDPQQRGITHRGRKKITKLLKQP